MEEHQLLIVYLSELPDDEAMLIVASLLPQLRNHLAKTASPRTLETLTGLDPIEIDFRLIGAFLKLFEMQTRLSEIGMREPTHQTVLEQISEFEPGRAFIIAAWLFPALRPAFIEGAETAFYRDLFADPDQLRELATLALNDDEWAEIEPQLFAQQRASQAPLQAPSASDKCYTDEIYEHLVYDGFKTASFAAACPDLYDRTITCNGMSKGYVMTGWRLGFAAGPRDIIKAMDTLQSQNLGSPSSIAQAAAIVALEGEPKRDGENTETYMLRNARSFQARRDLAAEWLNRMPGLNCHKPEGAFYLYPGCAGVIGKTTPQGKRIETDEDFVIAMLEAEGIGTVHGGAFGHSPYFRISYALEKSELEDALRRIERFCQSLR